MFRHASSKFLKFGDYISIRRTQAEKSLLIQVNGSNSVSEVSSYLTSQFGPISSFFHYTLSPKSKYAAVSGGNTMTQSSASSGQVHWVLAEFNKEDDFIKALESTSHFEGTLPFNSAMCWFGQPGLSTQKTVKLKKKNSIVIPPPERLNRPADVIDFSKTKSLNEQIMLVEDSLKITELGIRVRFLLAHHLERSLHTFFPEGCVLPFGSTVSGIGRLGGDLDLVLLPDKTEIFPIHDLHLNNSRLWHQTKLHTLGSTTNSRFQVQRVMETIADIIQLFLPGCTQVQRILQARVPILRFWSEYTDIECDLSMTNSSGIHMSELIYIMTLLDSRFVSLLFAIRSWASARKITNPVPGRQPTNFMLVLLLIYFLQCQKILPTFDILFNNATKQDHRTTVDGIHCTFLRDPAKILTYFTPQNETKTLSELLYSFFVFYSEFDFTTRGISLFTGSAWGKPDSGPMYIQNPLERHLNVARNVSKEETTRLKSECCAALWKLETSLNNSDEMTEKSGMTTQFQNVSLQDILLTPQLNKSSQVQPIKMKDLLID